jgi:hypothetical protein
MKSTAEAKAKKEAAPSIITTSNGTIFEPITRYRDDGRVLEQITRVRNDQWPNTMLKVTSFEREKFIRIGFGVTAEKVKDGDQWKKISIGDENELIKNHVNGVQFLYDQVRQKYTDLKKIEMEATSFALYKTNTGERLDGLDGSEEPEGLDSTLSDRITKRVLKTFVRTKKGEGLGFEVEGELASADMITYYLQPRSPAKVHPARK